MEPDHDYLPAILVHFIDGPLKHTDEPLTAGADGLPPEVHLVEVETESGTMTYRYVRERAEIGPPYDWQYRVGSTELES